MTNIIWTDTRGLVTVTESPDGSCVVIPSEQVSNEDGPVPPVAFADLRQANEAALQLSSTFSSVMIHLELAMTPVGTRYRIDEMGIAVDHRETGYFVNHELVDSTGGLMAVQEIGLYEDMADVIVLLSYLTDKTEEVRVELIDMARSGEMPTTVASFSQLHDYMDANMLAGSDVMDNVERLKIGQGVEDASEAFCGAANAVSASINGWLKDQPLTKVVGRTPTMTLH
jgi:hypothetical protein